MSRRVLAAVGVGAAVTVLVAIVAVVFGLAFSVTIEGTSMEPTLRGGDRVQLDVLHRGTVERFDMVAAEDPRAGGGDGGRLIVKRVIGTPGDLVAVADGPRPVVLVRPKGEDQAYAVVNPAWGDRVGVRAGGLDPDWSEVPEGAYWLLGDNWGASTDSRSFGSVSADEITMRLGIRVWPLDRFGEIGQDQELTPVDIAGDISPDR